MGKRTLTVCNNAAGIPAMRIIDHDHRRYTDTYRKGATAITTITSYDGSRKNPDPWLEIAIEVIDPADSRGTRRSKTHFITMNAEERSALIKVLTEMEVTEPNIHAEIIC